MRIYTIKTIRVRPIARRERLLRWRTRCTVAGIVFFGVLALWLAYKG